MLGDSGIGKLAASILGVALVWIQGCSESPPAKPEADVSEAYHLSHLPAQIQTALDSIDGALQSQRVRFTAAQFAVANRLMEEQSTAEMLKKRTLERLTESAEPGFLDATLEWLRTPRVQQIMQAGIATESPTGVAQMKGFVDQKQANPPSEKRLELIERYNRATHLPRLIKATILLSGYGVAIMADAVAPTAERLGPETLRESVDNRRTLLDPFFMEVSSITSLFAFRDFSDDEIESFVIFSESAAGKWYFETTSSVFLDTLEETIANLGPVFVAALRAEPSS